MFAKLNGKNDPVKIFFNSTQPATLQMVPKIYLGKDSVPDAHIVTNVKALAKSIQSNPGAIAFSGSKFEEDGFKPKFVDTDSSIPYILAAKKPLSPEMQTVFTTLKKGK
jgi:hypothetical protein